MGKSYRFCLTCVLFFLTCCSSPLDHQVQGYIEGEYTYIATSVSGVLKHIWVQKGIYVTQGQRLFALELEPELDVYHSAQENLQQNIAARDAIAANLTYAKLTFERNEVLVAKHAIQVSLLDDARSRYLAYQAQLAQANANIEAARASLSQAAWTQAQKTVFSPVNAFVFDTYYRLGEYTETGKPILSLLAPQNIKAVFYVQAPELAALHLQDKVQITCEQCHTPIIGHITYISPTAEYTPPIIYSNETNAKLIFRIEAKFANADAIKLHPGQPIFVTYHDDRR